MKINDCSFTENTPFVILCLQEASWTEVVDDVHIKVLHAVVAIL